MSKKEYKTLHVQKEKRKNYEPKQYKPDSSDEYIEKKVVKSSLFLSYKQLEQYGLVGVQCICKNVFINKNIDDDKSN
jgi:hypothetical protein